MVTGSVWTENSEMEFAMNNILLTLDEDHALLNAAHEIDRLRRHVPTEMRHVHDVAAKLRAAVDAYVNDSHPLADMELADLGHLFWGENPSMKTMDDVVQFFRTMSTDLERVGPDADGAVLEKALKICLNLHREYCADALGRTVCKRLAA